MGQARAEEARVGLSQSNSLGPPQYEEVYLKAYANSSEARRGLGAYFRFYNDQRPHQALGYQTPAEVFHGGPALRKEESKERRCTPEAVLVS